jgi:hypothetical protein
MQGDLMTELFQPRRQLHDADRRHAIGQHRKIGLTGNEIETGWMD